MRGGGDPTLVESRDDPLSVYSVEFLLEYISRRTAEELAAARQEDRPKPRPE
jgi:hypothetical protein